MIRKLRQKSMLINMTFITIMLILILGTLYYSTKSNLERESIRMMNSISINPMYIAPPSNQDEEPRLPYFTILINEEGESVGFGGGFFDLSDPELIQDILHKTEDQGTNTGILEDYNLRFLYTQSPIGQCIVYADVSNERSTLRNLAQNYILIGGGAFLAFLAISFLLAKWAVKPVEKAWNQQRQFVADASHELKTPLTVIMTDAELLAMPDCTEEEREQLSETILSMSGQMRGLVESLLELARMDNSGMKTMMGPVPLSEVLMNSAMTFEPVFFEKGLPFEYEIEPDISIQGIGTHLKQLAEILLDNAAKYASPKGKTRFTLSADSSQRYLLCVSNEGPNIEEEDLKKLFIRFFRADKARTDRSSYGLGLAIAESIVREHHGKIWAESKDGWNSFFVELPR